MPEATETKRWTSEELFALPDEPGVERYLIRGELVERRADDDLSEPNHLTHRNPDRGFVTSQITFHLIAWVRTLDPPRGAVFNGEIYFRLCRDPETNVGIDVAYASAELLGATPRGAKFLDGPPILAVGVLSPNDTQEEIHAKIEEYLRHGTREVWIADPFDQTVTVYRPAQKPVMVNDSQQLVGGDTLAGFCVSVSELFR